MTRKMKLSLVLLLTVISFLAGTRATKVVEAVSDKTKWKDMVGGFFQPTDPAESVVPDSIINKNTGLTVVKRLTIPLPSQEEAQNKLCDKENLGEITIFPGVDDGEGNFDRDRVKICIRESIGQGQVYQWTEITN